MNFSLTSICCLAFSLAFLGCSNKVECGNSEVIETVEALYMKIMIL